MTDSELIKEALTHMKALNSALRDCAIAGVTVHMNAKDPFSYRTVGGKVCVDEPAKITMGQTYREIRE